MKQFVFENKTKQFHEMILYAHSPEFESASVKEMENFLYVFLKHFQHTKHDDGSVTPFEETNFASQQWRACVAHIRQAIEVKKSNSHHRWLLGVSVGTLLVLIATLGYQVWNTESKRALQAQEYKTTAPNKPLPTSP